MIKFFVTAALLGLVLLAISCRRGNSIISKSDDQILDINYWGEVRINDEESCIESITPGGFLKYRSNDKRMNVTSNGHGEVSYELFYDGRRLDAHDREREKFIAGAIREMLAFGFDAKGRLKRIYQAGGNAAVLNKIDEMKADNLKAMYLQYLLQTDSLSPRDLELIAYKITHRIGSDFEKANLLRTLIHNEVLSPEDMAPLLESIRSVGSDYEKGRLLRDLAKSGIPLQENFQGFLLAVKTLGSDVEKSNTLAALINSEISSEQEWLSMINTTNWFSSDVDKRNLLKKIAGQMPVTESLKSAFLDMARTIRSEPDYRNLVKDFETANNQ